MFTIYKRSWPFLKQFAGKLVLFALGGLALGAVSLLGPYVTGLFLDALEGGGDMSALIGYALLFLGLGAGEFVLSYVNKQLYSMLQIGMGARMTESAVSRIQKTSLSYLSQKDTEYLTQQINWDSNNISMYCANIAQRVIINGLQWLVPLIVLFRCSWGLGIAMAGLNGVYAGLYFLFKKPVYKAGMETQEAVSQYFAKEGEQIQNAAFIQMQGIADTFIHRLSAAAKATLQADMHENLVGHGFTGSNILLKALSTAAVFLAGGAAVLKGSLSLGQLTVLISYFTMSMAATEFFFDLGKDTEEIRVSLDRLEEIFSQKPQTNGTKVPEDIEKAECRGLRFGYGEKTVVKDRSAAFEKGKMYALAGENGSGKSTLLNLLLGLYIDEYEGEVAYDGVSIRELDMETLRRKYIGVSEQEPMLLPETLRFNLTLEDGKEVDEEEFEDLCRILGLKECMEGLPQGLNTVIQENTGNLSGGEKQKLSLVRALLKHPKLLVLDEPTSALDKAGRENLCRYLQKIKKDAIILVSTHDKALLDACDEILQVEKLTEA